MLQVADKTGPERSKRIRSWRPIVCHSDMGTAAWTSATGAAKTGAAAEMGTAAETGGARASDAARD